MNFCNYPESGILKSVVGEVEKNRFYNIGSFQPVLHFSKQASKSVLPVRIRKKAFYKILVLIVLLVLIALKQK